MIIISQDALQGIAGILQHFLLLTLAFCRETPQALLGGSGARSKLYIGITGDIVALTGVWGILMKSS